MGLFSTIGDIINDVSGTTASARQQYQAQMNLQKDAQNFSKWQMANAHQMEVQDLQNAGLNPVLSAGGNGASAGVTEGSASAGVTSGNPIETILNALNTAKQIEKTNAEIDNINADTSYIDTQTKNAGTKTTAMQNDENFAKTWWGRNISPALRDIFGGGGAASGAVAGAAVSQANTSARKARTPKRNHIGFK